MTPETIPVSMLGNGIKVGVTYEPYVSQITQRDGGRQGFRVLYSSHDAAGLISDVLVFDRKQIARHPAEIKALVQGYVEGLEYLQKQPDEASRIIAKAMGITPAQVKGLLHTIHNPTLQEMLVNLERSPSPQSFATTGDVIARILKAKAQITAAAPFEETVDSEFVKAVLAQARH
jgi:NitT/TauT family transport system substrate-binding protein